jgi:hypothetical protein
MTADQEHYVHFAECIENLTSAWCILKELDSVAPGVIRAAAYRMALVEYGKPYKVSFGTHKKRNFLPAPDLPSADLALHNQILHLRDQVLAHSDLTLKDAIIYPSRVQGQPFVAIGANRLPSFPNASAVIALVGRTLDQMYLELARLDEVIAPKT